MILKVIFWTVALFGLGFGGKIFTVRKVENCPEEESKSSSRSEFDIFNASLNRLQFRAHFEFYKKIPGPLELVLKINKCDMKMTNCQDYDKILITGMCQKFKDTNALYSPILQAVKPPFECPIKAGNYTVTDTTVNLDIVSRLPLNGHRYLVTFKLISGAKNNRKLVWCVDSETLIRDVRERKKKN